jgi:hypothetical protein
MHNRKVDRTDFKSERENDNIKDEEENISYSFGEAYHKRLVVRPTSWDITHMFKHYQNKGHTDSHSQ